MGDFQEEHGFGAGSVIEYTPIGGGSRRVKVETVDSDIKNGRPGFDGIMLGITDEPTGEFVWGYCYQVTRVITEVPA